MTKLKTLRIGLVASLIATLFAVLGHTRSATTEQLSESAFSGSLDHPAIQYGDRAPTDRVTELNRKIANDQLRLKFSQTDGYLRSLLAELEIPLESQIMVFSKTGIQGALTSPNNPRALFFNDSVVVGYVRGAPILELAAHDAEQGVSFYTVDQTSQTAPALVRRDTCLSCHLSFNSLDVPGFLVRSAFVAPNGGTLPQLGSYLIDHRSPLDQRWGGYYVTGSVSMRHMGNATVKDLEKPETMITDETLHLKSLESKFDTHGYPTNQSDIIALMVFDHQTHMLNLLTRVGWEVRVALYEHRLKLTDGFLYDAINELVDYLLFVDEVPLAGPVRGSSGFTELFSAQGPKDSKGRSLRQLDLQTRLLRYPCSYMVYSDAFDALPREAKAAIYERMSDILSGRDTNPRYSRLSAADRRAITEILRDTKKDLPTIFG